MILVPGTNYAESMLRHDIEEGAIGSGASRDNLESFASRDYWTSWIGPFYSESKFCLGVVHSVIRL